MSGTKTLVGGALAWLLLVSSSQAYEDQWSFAVETGYGHVATDEDLPRNGALFDLEVSLGLTDAWSLRSTLTYALHPSGDGHLHVGAVGVEAIYLIDVVQLVPNFGFGIDVLGTIFDSNPGIEPGGHIVIGLDYLLTRAMFLEFDFRTYYLPLSGGDKRLDPVYVTFTLGAGWLFDL